MDYEDFTLTLKTRGTVTTIEADFRQQDAECESDPATLLTTAAPLIEALAANDVQALTAQSIGTALFNALFQGDVAALYRNARARTQEREKGLRLRLSVRDPALVTLPLEYLYDPTLDRFLTLHSETTITRTQANTHVSALPVSGELRLLFVVGDPIDAPPLNIAAERAVLEVLEEEHNLSVTEIPATYEALLTALRQPYHILHFTGHGLFEEEQGYLLFKNNEGITERRTGEEIGVLLSGQKNLRLVVLNACEGSVTDSSTAFAGVAQKWIQQELPAVIAMQARIRENDALVFSREFYAALGDGYTVEYAVMEGRKAIRKTGATWGIPTLYTQTPTLFTISKATPAQAAAKLWEKYLRLNAHTQTVVHQRLLTRILLLDPNHTAAKKAVVAVENEAEGLRAYEEGKRAHAEEQWEVAYKAFHKAIQFSPKLKAVLLDYIAEVRGKLGGRGSQITNAQLSDYQPLLNALLDGKLVPFLGWDAALCGRLPQGDWVVGQPFMPTAQEVARHLAETFNYPVASLSELSQQIALVENPEALYEQLGLLFNVDYPPTTLHRLLAEIPHRLKEKEYPRLPTRRFVIVSAAFDTMLERAFRESGQRFHLFSYSPGTQSEVGMIPPRFIHTMPDDTLREVKEPNKDAVILADNEPHPIIIKLCGAGITNTPNSVIVTEDQYLQYPAQPLTDLLPFSVLAAMKPCTFLFLGYNLQAWNLRLLWQRIRFAPNKVHTDAWAVHPDADLIARRYWEENKVKTITPSLEGLVAYVSRFLDEREPNVRRAVR